MSHKENKRAIESLNRCAAECNHCAVACLDEEHADMLARCIRLDMDCAQLCSLTAGFLARGSEFAGHLLTECVLLCEECAKECDSHSRMEHCARCAEICRECAEACRISAKEHLKPVA